MSDYFNIQTATAEPKASSMIESFRAISYSKETAIADIVDNSIAVAFKQIGNTVFPLMAQKIKEELGN